MRSIFSLLFLILILSPAVAQKKQVSNQLIWSSREFASDYVYSVTSMNDGEHFSVLEDNKIIKYSYKNFSKA
jgi:dipeptidyl-peptidase-4